MFLVSYSIIAMSSVTFVLGLVYLYIYFQDHHVYMKFWGTSWIIYSLSFTLDFLKFDGMNTSVYIIAKQSSYLVISMLFLFGSYNFFKSKAPVFWNYFAAAGSALLVAAAFSPSLFLPLTLHTAILLCFISVWNGLLFISHSWQIKMHEKYLAGFMFILWGIYKGYYPFIHPDFWVTPWSYLSGAVLINMLSILVLLVYFKKNKMDIALQEKLFRLIAENAGDLIYLYNLKPSTGFEYVSPAVTRMLSLMPEEIYSDGEIFFRHAHPEDQPALRDAFADPLKALEKSANLRWLRKDGSMVWGELNHSVILNESGAPVAIEGILRDITQRKLAEETLSRVEKSRYELITNISHELRTPITLIQGYVEAILDGVISNPADFKGYLRLIHSRTSGLSRLINDLFQLTQLECGKIDFSFYETGAHGLIRQLYGKYKPDVEASGICFMLKIAAAKDVQITVDTFRIDQVFSNLIFNAVKHTPPGGSITISCVLAPYVGMSDSLEKELIVSIQDSGCGIQADDLPHIFDRFYKGSSPHFAKGGGLGLSIAKEIIEYHGGRIWVETAAEKGSLFSFALPVSNEQGNNAKSASALF